MEIYYLLIVIKLLIPSIAQQMHNTHKRQGDSMTHNIPRKTGLRQERSKFSTERRMPGDYTAKRVPLPPFVRGQTVKVTIEEIGHNGDGIAHQDGFTIFVPNSAIGETVTARVWRVQRTIIFTKRTEKARMTPGRGERVRVPRMSRTKMRKK